MTLKTKVSNFVMQRLSKNNKSRVSLS
uniref:Uncharacterized protein n=1 Tax=Rhizophora mucronata TaxID=61149 RepID=A0A2P2NLN6_RHIMU